MKLPVKITLLLAIVIILFLGINSIFFYKQINSNYQRQSEEQISLGLALLDHRIESLKQNLQSELEQLTGSIFTENETVLASMLSNPPEFTPEVVTFAEKLRRRTTLHFLELTSAERTILASSLNPAAFGKTDVVRSFPIDEPKYTVDDSLTLELKRKAIFGNRAIFLRGGYFMRQEIEKIPFPAGLRVSLLEGSAAPPTAAALETLRTIELKDYRGQPAGTLVVSASNKEFAEQRKQLIRNSTILVSISLLACLLVGHLLSLWISRPLARLTEAATAMSLGLSDVRVEEASAGEIAELQQAFNRMVEQLDEKQRKLIQTERIAAWQEIARHLAHEIKNPLTPIRTSIANLRLCLEKAPDKFAEIFLESSGSVLEEVEKLRHLADEFSRFARLPAPRLKPGDLNEILRKSSLLYATKVEFQPGPIPSFSFDAEQISEVVHNLLQNAVDASSDKQPITIHSGTVASTGGSEAFFTVEDQGSGMNEQIRRQIFTPYFTTKEKGTGLGLAIVQRIVAEHNGKIFVESESGKGTKFEVRLLLTF